MRRLSREELAEYVEHIDIIGDCDLDELARPLRTQVCKFAGWEDAIIRTSRSQELGCRRFSPKLPPMTLR